MPRNTRTDDADRDQQAAGRARWIAVFAVVLLSASLGAGLGVAFGAEEGSASDSGQASALSAPPVADPGVELASQRTATSQTFRLPNGALETRIFEAPINYRDREGDWQPIGDRLEETEAGGLTNGPNSFDVNLPERLGAAHPVRLSIGDQWIAFQLVGQPLEPAQLVDGMASYESPDGATSFDFSSLANGLKEDIEIAGPSAPSSFEFELSASAGLTPSLTEDGLLQFRGAEGQLLASMPAPVISDSAPGARPENAVHYKLNPQGENEWRLVVETDPEWLEQPGRVWPANIDPTTYIAESPSLDCYMVSNLHASHGCGSTGWQSLNAKAKYVLSGENETGRSILRFNLESIPTNAYVTEATIGLNAPSAVKNTSGVQLRQVSAAWTSAVTWIYRESSVPWTTRGGDYTSAGSEILTSERGSQAGWWAFSQGLTPLVRGWVSKSISNQGVIVKLRDEANRECSETSCIERLAEFQSSAAADTSKRPYMAVAYYPVAPSTSKVVSPSEGTRTARRLKLKAAWSAAGTTGVTFQYKLGGHNAEFTNIPSNLVRNAKGEPVSWPMAVQGNQSEPLYFDALHADPSLLPHGGDVKVRALFEGLGASGYSVPVSATINRFLGGTRDATATVGPGTVNLLTGNYTISQTDVSIAGFGSALEFSRTDNSRGGPAHPEEGGVLGAGWQPGVPVEAAGGAAWRKVREVVPTAEEAEEGIGTYAILVDLEGYEYSFEASGSNFISPSEATGWILSRQDATHLALADSEGNRTIFEKEPSGSDYLPASVSQTGSGNQTRMVYELVEGKKRLSEIIAPAAAGVNCTEAPRTTQGCRVLTFTFQPASAWGAPSSFGYRLSLIKYYGPSGPSSMSSWEVAQYSYNAEGRLVQEWDPRIHPNLVESYTYKAGGQLATLSPPGEEPWSFDYYGSYDGEEANGRLLSVKRPSLLASPSVAQTTLVYGVPINGAEAPYDMSGTAVAQWGQQDIPVDATAIFPPDQVPGSPPSSYSRAAVYYMDAEGQLVNTATPSGAGTSAPSITTAEPDEHGNVVRELGAQNRLRALAAGSESIARSHQLETKRNFSTDGTQMEEEWGPLHQVRLESGETVQARLHTTIQYDGACQSHEAWPGTGVKPHLPTRVTTGASIPGQGIDADQRLTETCYDWNLRKPIESIVDPLGLKLRTRIAYDAISGLPTERSLPANPGGGDAHTTKILYYSAGSNPDSSCANNPNWANLPCKVMPATQPGTEGQPQLLVTSYVSYSPMGQPTEVLESPGGDSHIRRTLTTYDTAGRETNKRQEGGGTAIAPTQTLYSSTTGRPVEQRFTCETSCEGFDNQALTTTYDALGRVSAYQDADGNASTVTYDLLGRPVTIYDGKGTQSFGYDPTSGLLVSLQDSAAGTFTAAYNADGSIVEEGLPDGLLATTTYDETGAPTHLSYEKKTFCSLNCTWLEFGAERSIYGQVLAQASTLSSQQYTYDKAGRLTLTKDTPQGGGCSTRSYSFDADSNRTALVSRAPGIGGVCDLSSEGTTQKYKYDAGDRLIDSGITYDNFGRITSLPSADAGGATLSTTYYSNDLIASQTQGAISNSYQLDAALRQRQRTETGGSEPGTEIYHYAGGSDSPAWIDRGSSWSRNVAGIGGGLAAIQDSAKGTTLQLTNLHGDVVATASLNPEATKLLANFEYDEFGNPKSGVAGKYGWLGGKQRRTELPSGVIQMGVRSYVPAIGRFISTDPVPGGSANAYDYANANPVTGFDLAGTSPYNAACLPGIVGCKCKMWAKFRRGGRGRLVLTTVRKCNVAGGITLGGMRAGWGAGNGGGFHSISAPRPVHAQIEPVCRPTDSCQNYQKHVRTFYCEPGKEYEFSQTWEFQINLEGLPAHTLHVKIEQFCPM